MKKIKSFIYLDEYKLYSISSQIFEGLTEYIVQSESQNYTEDDKQKGPLGSGRIVADIFKEEKSTLEKKNLYDYAYNLLEDELILNNLVLELNEKNVSIIKNEVNQSFVKITGTIIFNDMKILSDLIENFNNIGESLGYLTMENEYKNQLNQISHQIEDIKDRNQKAKQQQLVNKSKSLYKQILKDSGLILEEEYLKQLKYILDFGYNGQFEIKMPFNSTNDRYLISSILNRKYLKENELGLITKYSRKTEKKFTIFGIITQNEKFEKDEKEITNENNDLEGMKEAVLNLVDKLADVEATFTGKLKYEYIIDPIAIYREL